MKSSGAYQRSHNRDYRCWHWCATRAASKTTQKAGTLAYAHFRGELLNNATYTLSDPPRAR